MDRLLLRLVVLLALAVAPARATVVLDGAGATFPFPLYSKWFAEFGKRFPDVRINYQPIGSGGGITQFIEGKVDFGATDGPMTDEQLAALPAPVLHLPTALGAVVITFNVNHIDRLRFDPETIAGIFLGRITSWKDPAIRRSTTMPLPDAPITVVHRADGSGTTYVFTDYLSKVSADWRATVGRGTSVQWPTGLAGNGNQGVTDLVKQTPNSIGYVELAYSVEHDLPYAGVRNRAGQFPLPTLESVTAAARAVVDQMPDDFRVSITDAEAPDAYPISSFTWLLVPAHMPDVDKGGAMKTFLEWMLADGQALAPSLLYPPLPPQVVTLERRAIDQIVVGP